MTVGMTEFAGSGLQIKFSPLLQQPTDPSSSVSIQSKELRSSRKCARQRNASSLSGWYSMIVVGRQIGVSAVAYKMMTPVSCAIRCQKLQITCCQVALTRNRSKHYFGLVGKLSLLTSKLAILQIGGLLLGKAFQISFDSFVVLVCWLLWKKRNNRTFDRRVQTIQDVLAMVADEIVAWRSMQVIGVQKQLQLLQADAQVAQLVPCDFLACGVLGLVPLLCNQS